VLQHPLEERLFGLDSDKKERDIGATHTLWKRTSARNLRWR
jgi:hypothetical protein